MSENFVPAHKLDRAEFVRRLFAHVIPMDRDWRDALLPEYWHRVMGASTGAHNRMEPGDRVEVYSEDRSTKWEMDVLDANPFANPPRLAFVVRAVYPPDLPLPNGIIGEQSKFRIRGAKAGGFEIVDRDGRVVAERIADRHAAQLNLAALDRIEAASAGAQAEPEPRVRRPA